MFDTAPTIENSNVRVFLPTKAKMAKLGYHAGEAPANGIIPSSLPDILHKVPVPPRYHLSATAALGIAARALRRDNPFPAALLAAVAETFAADAVAALKKARKVKEPPKKPGKKPYSRSQAEADAAQREVVAHQLLLAFFDEAVHCKAAEADGPTYWVGDTTPKFSNDVAFTLRAQQGAEKMGVSERVIQHHFDRQQIDRYGENGVASTLAARDSAGPLDLIVSVTDARGNGDGLVAGTITGDHDSRITDLTHLVCSTPALYTQNTRDELRAVGGDGQRSSSLCGPSGKQFDMVVGALGTDVPPMVDISGMTVNELAATAQAHVAHVGRQYLLRRLTPMECMRLQAFEPDHCMVPFPGKRRRKLSEAEAAELIAFHAAEGRHYTKEQLESFVPDSAQYACAGNSIAVVCLDFLMGNVTKVAAPLLAPACNDNQADWPARIEAAKRAGMDTVDAIAACLAEDRTRNQAGDEEIVMAGLGCTREEARSVIDLLAAA